MRPAASLDAIIEIFSLTFLVRLMNDNVIGPAYERVDAVAGRIFSACAGLLGRTGSPHINRGKKHHEQATKRNDAVAFRCCKER
jgi:hypothetical protein